MSGIENQQQNLPSSAAPSSAKLNTKANTTNAAAAETQQFLPKDSAQLSAADREEHFNRKAAAEIEAEGGYGQGSSADYDDGRPRPGIIGSATHMMASAAAALASTTIHKVHDVGVALKERIVGEGGHEEAASSSSASHDAHLSNEGEKKGAEGDAFKKEGTKAEDRELPQGEDKQQQQHHGLLASAVAMPFAAASKIMHVVKDAVLPVEDTEGFTASHSSDAGLPIPSDHQTARDTATGAKPVPEAISKQTEVQGKKLEKREEKPAAAGGDEEIEGGEGSPAEEGNDNQDEGEHDLAKRAEMVVRRRARQHAHHGHLTAHHGQLEALTPEQRHQQQSSQEQHDEFARLKNHDHQPKTQHEKPSQLRHQHHPPAFQHHEGHGKTF